MEVRRISVPGLVQSVRIAPDGRIVVVHADWRKVDLGPGYTFRMEAPAVRCLAPDGRTLWERPMDPKGPASGGAVRLDPRGRTWVLGPSSIEAFGTDGKTDATVQLPGPLTAPRAVVLLADGFLVHRLRVRKDRTRERLELVCLTADGRIRWWFSPEPGTIGHDGLVQARAETGFRIERSPDREPKEWTFCSWCVSGPIVAIACRDSSGIGRVYGLDGASGNLVWMSDPAPWSELAGDGAGGVLLGQQGYGAFATERRDAAGAVTDRWPTHGHLVTDDAGTVRVLEMANDSDPDLHVSVLGPAGAVVRGPWVPGYYCGAPAVTASGEVFCWREDEVHRVGPDGTHRALLDAPAPEDSGVLRGRIWSSTPLVIGPTGQLVFGLGREVWIAVAGLEPPRTSPWSGTDAGPLGNPVAGWGQAPR